MKTRDSAVDLNRQLDAYAAVAKLPERNPRSRWGKWTTYAAATGAALAGASAASADIFYSGKIDLSGSQVGVPVGPSASIGFDAQAGQFRHLVSTTNGSGVRHQSLNLFREFLEAEGNHAAFAGSNGPGQYPLGLKSFASGAPISESRPRARAFHSVPGTIVTHGGHLATRPSFLGHGGVSTYGQQDGVAKGTLLLGFATYRASGNNGPIPGSEVGWVRVKFDTTFPGSFEIIDYAYNTDGPIDAGQTSATPEPNYLPLMLLAGGAGGVLAWKRRRSQPAPDA
jgi:hypothetical protein